MAYTAKFLDNQTVGVDDFNNIIADLCGEGVIPGDDGYNFETGVAYKLKKLNDMTRDAVYAAGVVPSSETALAVSFDTKSGTATINAGAAVFSTGLIFKVTETETVAFDSTATQYVYLVHDTQANTATIEVSKSATGTETRFVVELARWVDGAAEDRRQYAEGKLKCCANWNGTVKADFTYTGSGSGWNSSTVTVWDKGDEMNFIVFVAYTDADKLETYSNALYSISIVTQNSDGGISILCLRKNYTNLITDEVWLSDYSGLTDFKVTSEGITATLNVYGTSYNSTKYPVEMYVSVVE